ncbi:hypothetical protein NDU88_009146 [Pleurodeles waltl]|uniref:Uncharacterized protein n=1 Tax=Pleurodeles waltl TaxID=8319 RepID=A0AAV7RXJ2_PLEWA|nr:hypothetical protein NDU88_009146 [Pleurodeles waltl]
MPQNRERQHNGGVRNEEEGGGRDRGRNSQQGPRRQAEAASPRDAEPLAQIGGFHRARDETQQCRAGEEGGRENAGAVHVLGRTWPKQHPCIVPGIHAASTVGVPLEKQYDPKPDKNNEE